MQINSKVLTRQRRKKCLDLSVRIIRCKEWKKMGRTNEKNLRQVTYIKCIFGTANCITNRSLLRLLWKIPSFLSYSLSLSLSISLYPSLSLSFSLSYSDFWLSLAFISLHPPPFRVQAFSANDKLSGCSQMTFVFNINSSKFTFSSSHLTSVV